jgi:acyl-CoA synthetase (AMP-forming)/AMP-acid ligase II
MVTRKKDYNTMLELLQARSTEDSDKLIYQFLPTGDAQSQISLTFGELEMQAKAIAALIQQHTLPGDRAILIYPPGIDYIVAFWACLYAGVLAVPAYPPSNKATIEKLQAILDNAKPKVILSDTMVINSFKRLGIVKSIADNPLLKRLLKKFASKMEELCQWDFKSFEWLNTSNVDTLLAASWKPPFTQANDIAFLQYTSGSTAMPKGVMVTHANLLNNMELLYQTINKIDGDRMVSWLPPYHDLGLIGSLLFSVYSNFPITFMSPIVFLRNPYLWLKAISDFKGTISGGPNFAYELCIKNIDTDSITKETLDLTHWRLAFNGAEPINTLTLKRFAEKFSAYGFNDTAHHPFYGLAEATIFVSGMKKTKEVPVLHVDADALATDKIKLVSPNDDNAKGLVGTGLAPIPLIIVDPQKKQFRQELEIGEVWVSGDCIAKGYWQNTAETNAVFNATLAGNNQTSYLKTGDLGFIKDDNLYIMGRIKDLIIINGRNYYPHDIENSVNHSDTLIRKGCVAAFSVTKADMEQLAIIAEINQPTADNLYETTIQLIIKQINLHHGLSPHTIVLIQPKSLPKTTSGKLRRNYARTLLEHGQLPVIYQWHNNT